jgi:hypothetical protein
MFGRFENSSIAAESLPNGNKENIAAEKAR